MNTFNPQPIRRVSASKYRGLGDVVEIVAKPIARAIDKAIGTNVANCAGCAERREILNRLLPYNLDKRN